MDKMIVLHMNGRFQRVSGQVDSMTMESKDRSSGGTHSLLGHPTFTENKPVKLKSLSDLQKVELPYPDTDKQVSFWFEGVPFGIPTKPEEVYDSMLRRAAMKELYQKWYLEEAAGPAEAQAHQLKATGYKVLLFLATIIVLVFGIMALSKMRQ